jgi:prepilin-type N-terminal cleavage/methylation domain-containing protein
MKQLSTVSTRGFSLVELLVVVTILAVISTVAYVSLSGSTDKAKNSKRLEHMNTAETALGMFRQEKQYLPLPNANSGTNLWGYNASVPALSTNTGIFVLTPDGNAIASVTSGSGGGVIYQIGGSVQIGAKGVLEQSLVGKQYLSQDIADPSSDTKVGTTQTLKEFGIGRYIYAVYSKPTGGAWNADGKSTTGFNIAITVMDDQKGYVTKIG